MNGLDYRFAIEGDFPKFGNDDPRVDEIAASLVEDFIQNLKYPDLQECRSYPFHSHHYL